jgi:signal transduction histidine kinase
MVRTPRAGRARPRLPLLGLRLPQREFATLLLGLGLGGYGLFAIGGALLRADGPTAVALVVAVLAVVGLQAGYLSRPDRPPRAPWSLVALGVQAVLVLVPLLSFGVVWQGFTGFLPASALLVLPRALGLLVFGGTLALVVPLVVGGPVGEASGPVYAAVYAVTSTTTGTLAVYGLSVLARLVVQAYDARGELARLAVAAERVRLAQEVNGLLGESLSAIALRGELVVRLLRSAPEIATRELEQLSASARRAGDDVRRVTRVQRALRDDAVPAAPQPGVTLAPRLARGLLAVSLLSFFVFAVVRAGQERGPGAAVLAAAAGAAFLGLALQLVPRDGVRGTLRRRAVLLVLLAALTFLPGVVIGAPWLGLPAYLAGLTLAVLPRAAAVAGWLAVLVAGVGADVLAAGMTGYDRFYLAFGSILISLVVYGLATLPRLVAEIDAARADIGRLAVAQERLRVSRDVHDLLGLSLSTIVLKSELAARLVTRDPDRARTELDDVLDAARRAVGDVRTVLAGEGRMSLEEECRLAEATLAAASIRVRLDRAGDLPGQPVDTVLATVLREAVTNVLRHSAAGWCEISLRTGPDRVVLDIVNDGVGRAPAPAEDDRIGGNGLVNMVQRVELVGGELSVQRDDGRHRLRASVPVGP